MISINKYGQNIDLSNVQELNGKKSYSLDNIDSDKTLVIRIPQGVKFVTTLQDEDLKIDFSDNQGNVFELILKNMAQILVQNDTDKLIEIIREESDETLASITDLASALEAAAGGEQAQGNTNSDSGRVNDFENDGLDFEENSYPNDRISEDAASQEPVAPPTLSSLNNLIDDEQVLNSIPTIEVNSTLTVDEDDTTTITFVSNDIDGDTLTSNATAINGVVTINGNVITYTPNENFNGNDVITLSVNDGTVTTTQTINVTVNPVNDAPTIEVNSTLTVDEDDTTTITFVSNDIDGDTLTSNATAINGVVTINGNVITYTPNENFNGNDVITLSVNDGTVTTTQTINVTINPVNDAPTIEIQENSLLENIILEGQLTASDIDTNFANLIFSTTEVIDGFVLNTDGSYTFDANNYDYLAEGEILELAIPITVTDDFNASASSVLNIKIIGTNDRPIVENLIVNGIEELIGFDAISNYNPSSVYHTYDLGGHAQKFIATENILSKLEILFASEQTGTFTFHILDENMSTIYTSEIIEINTFTNQIVSYNFDAMNLIIGKQYIIDFDIGSNDLAMIVIQGNLADGNSYLYGSGNNQYQYDDDSWDHAIKLTYGSGEKVILETNGLETIYEGILALKEDLDVTDTHVFELVNDSITVTSEYIDVSKITDLRVSISSDGTYKVEGNFDALANKETATITFDYVAIDNSGAENAMSEAKTVTLTITGTNDAPIITNENPVLTSLSETDFLKLSEIENAYYVIKEKDVFDALGVTDVDLTDGLSVSLIEDSSVFDSMGVNDSTKISFQVKAFDGTDYSKETIVSVTVNGSNDAPIITNENPVLTSLSETDFLKLSEIENAYYVIKEKDVFDALGVTDVDLTDGLSVSLIEDSSVFELNGEDVTSNKNGVFQLTADDIEYFGLIGKANVGDFFVYSTEFDSMGVNDSTKISFQVKAFDGTDYSKETIVSVTVNGSNDAPIITNENPVLTSLSETDFLKLSEIENAYYVIKEKEVFDALGVTDVDLTDGLSVSLIKDSSVFELNGEDVTSNKNGVFQLTADDIEYFGLIGKANVGDFFVYSTEFDSMGVSDSTKISFQVKAFDGIAYSNEATVSVTVNGSNDAPIITNENPVLTSLSETDFLKLSEIENAYYVIKEKDVFDALGVTDVDLTDGLSVSLIEDSSVFELNGEDVTSNKNGVFQLTADDIEYFGLIGKANVGDFFVYSTEFDSMGVNDSTKISFQVKAFDGTDYSKETIVSVTVNGSNDAPIITNENPVLTSLSETDFLKLSEIENAYYVIKEKDVFDALGVTDVDLTDGLSVSLIEDSSVFELNGEDVTSNKNGVFQLTADDIEYFGLIGKANVGDFFVYSTEFDSMGVNDSTKISFQVKAFDGTDYSKETIVSVTVNGSNDAPIITNENPVLTSLSETDFLKLSEIENAYYVIKEKEVFDALGVTDVDLTDGLSVSLIKDSSVFELNGEDVTSNKNGVFQLTADDIEYFGLIGKANVGDFFVYSTEFDSMGVSDSTKISFQVKAFDGIAYSNEATVSVTVNGSNDAPIITNENPVLTSLSETDFLKLSEIENAYYVIKEKDVFDALGVTDVDLTDGLSVSLIEDSSVFELNGEDVTSNKNGVFQLTADDIEYFGLIGKANVGDFFVYSTEFDSMGVNDSTKISFQVKAFDGTDYSKETIVSVTVNGSNDAPITSAVYTQIQNDDTSKIYKGQLSAKDVDLNDTLTYSVDNSSINVALTISNINGLSTLTNLNTSALESAFLDIKPAISNFIATGDLSGLLTLNPQTIATSKAAVITLQGLLNSNPDLKNSIVLLKDFVVANQDSIIENTSLVAQDIVLLESLLTQENLTVLVNLYEKTEDFLESNPALLAAAEQILADNVITNQELNAITNGLVGKINSFKAQLSQLVNNNEDILNIINISQIIEKLQEIVTIDTTNNQVSIESKVTPTLAGMILTLDEDTGEYIVNNAFAEKFSSLGNLEISFDYNATDSQGTTDSSTASILITTEEINDTSISLDDGGILSFGEEQNINLGDLLENISTSVEIQDVDSIDLSNSEHILSNLTIKDFEDMVADDSSNTLVIDGENNDKIKLDLSVWSKDENDKDINSVNEAEDDGYITYTAKGTAEQTLTLLIDKDIVVENI